MKTFVFNTAEVKPILADSISAAAHRFAYGITDLKTDTAGLWLCMDPCCCFLQSNSIKPQRKPDGSVWRVYARGCEPDAGYKGDGRLELITADVLNVILRTADDKKCNTLTIAVDDQSLQVYL